MPRSDRRITLAQVHELESLGWRTVKTDRRIKASCPCGEHMLSLTVTASDVRTIRNQAALIARTLRACPGAPTS